MPRGPEFQRRRRLVFCNRLDCRWLAVHTLRISVIPAMKGVWFTFARHKALIRAKYFAK